MSPSWRLLGWIAGLAPALVATAISQWIQQPLPANQVFERVRFFDAYTGWITDDQSRIYGTTDGGLTWAVRDSISGGDQTIGIVSRDTVVYATWSGVSPYTTGIRRTSDRGVTWTNVDNEVFYYREFQFIALSTGFAAGGIPNSGSTLFAPAIRKTSNGGISWQTMWVGNYSNEFRSLSFPDSTYGWAITYGGLIYRTTNAGNAWALQDSLPADLPYHDIQFSTRDSGWVVGGIAGFMRVSRTTDGGAHWSSTTSAGPSLAEIQMIDSRTGWTLGLIRPDVLKTTDGGETWQPQQSIPASTGFYSISMVNQNLGWASSTGQVYKTTNGGTAGVQPGSVAPELFILEQNYPNPFNPGTSIKFQIPNSKSQNMVTLKVFDLLSREVATLVNEPKPPGEYSVRFDAGRLASGVYFYRLQAGSYAATRKLVVLR